VTLGTCLSFLRGLASWLSKPGFIRPPAFYGLELAEYQRSAINERDKSWSAQGLDVDGLIDKVAAFDPYVGGMLRLIRAFGLRKREAIMFRPNECVVNFADTGLPLAEKQGEEYIAMTGQEPPLRGGGEGLTREQEDAARLAVSRLAGHNRGRASAAYLGAVLHRKKGGAKGGADGGAAGGAPRRDFVRRPARHWPPAR
jgi:hypothetical protein